MAGTDEAGDGDIAPEVPLTGSVLAKIAGFVEDETHARCDVEAKALRIEVVIAQALAALEAAGGRIVQPLGRASRGVKLGEAILVILTDPGIKAEREAGHEGNPPGAEGRARCARDRVRLDAGTGQQCPYRADAAITKDGTLRVVESLLVVGPGDAQDTSVKNSSYRIVHVIAPATAIGDIEAERQGTEQAGASAATALSQSIGTWITRDVMNRTSWRCERTKHEMIDADEWTERWGKRLLRYASSP